MLLRCPLLTCPLAPCRCARVSACTHARTVSLAAHSSQPPSIRQVQEPDLQALCASCCHACYAIGTCSRSCAADADHNSEEGCCCSRGLASRRRRAIQERTAEQCAKCGDRHRQRLRRGDCSHIQSRCRHRGAFAAPNMSTACYSLGASTAGALPCVALCLTAPLVELNLPPWHRVLDPCELCRRKQRRTLSMRFSRESWRMLLRSCSPAPLHRCVCTQSMAMDPAPTPSPTL